MKCFCGETHETAVCRYCGAAIMLHRESGLTGWFARVGRWFVDGDCGRNAMSAFHAPTTT